MAITFNPLTRSLDNTVEGQTISSVTSTDLVVASEIQHEGDTDTKLAFDTNSIAFHADSAERLKITSSGAVVTGNLSVSGSTASLALTDDSDDPDYKLQNNNGQFRIFDSTNTENRFSINSSGVVDIAGRLDANGGAVVTGNLGVGTSSPSDLIHAQNSSVTNTKIVLESTGANSYPAFRIKNDAQTYDIGIDGATDNLRIYDVTNNDNVVVCKGNAGVQLNYDGENKFETTDVGATLTGNLTMTAELNLLGGSDSARFIDSQVGDGNALHFRRITGGDAGHEIMAKFHGGGSCELYHDNSTLPKLLTTSSGITVNGSVATQDMNMSNLNGSANEVDNTKGSWSLQEGANDLFLINRVNGKNYKFNLTEIN